MLVLTRKSNQSIMIGDDIEVTVLSNDGTKVRLGIQAPETIPVHRLEIYNEIRGGDQLATSGDQPEMSRAREGRAS